MSNLLITEGLGAEDLPFVIISLVAEPTQLILTFETEVILTGEALEPSKWHIEVPAGARPVTVTGVSVLLNVLTITTTEHQQGINYVLHLPIGIVDGSAGRPYAGAYDLQYVGAGVLPYLITVKGIDARTLDIVFSEAVREDDATNPDNYVIVGPRNVNVISAMKITDLTYRLKTSAMERDANYTVQAFNIRDIANNPIDTDT